MRYFSIVVAELESIDPLLVVER
jgi:hypothetical protein